MYIYGSVEYKTTNFKIKSKIMRCFLLVKYMFCSCQPNVLYVLMSND